MSGEFDAAYDHLKNRVIERITAYQDGQNDAEPMVAILRAQLKDALDRADAATVRASAEHEKRVALVMTLFEILPKIAHVDRDVADGWWCRVCQTHNDHRPACEYVAAMQAVIEGGKSV